MLAAQESISTSHRAQPFNSAAIASAAIHKTASRFLPGRRFLFASLVLQITPLQPEASLSAGFAA